MSTASNSRDTFSPIRRGFEDRASTDSALSLGLKAFQDGALQVNENDERLMVLLTDLPTLEPIWAYVCAFLNLAIPGTGTIFASILGYETCHKTHFLVGCLQFLTSIYVIGWIWSIYWGYLILRTSLSN